MSEERPLSRVFHRTMLFDFYGELLTEHQRNVYRDVIENDMSLSEAARVYGISRQAVSEMMKRVDDILTGYEDRLHLVSRFEKERDYVREIRKLTEKIRSADEKNADLYLERIEDITDSILEEM